MHRRVQMCCLCKSTGTSCAATTPATRGTRSAAICPRTSDSSIDVHAHEPETIYVVPIKSDSEHFPIDGKLRVYRSRTGGNDWEPLTKGLPSATATSTCCAMRWPSIRSILAVSISERRAARCTHPPTPETTGRRSSATYRQWSPSKSDTQMIRWFPHHLRTWRKSAAKSQLHVDEPVTQRSVLDALRPVIRCSAGRSATMSHSTPSVRSVLRLRARSLPRVSGSAFPEPSLGGGTVSRRRGNRRRLRALRSMPRLLLPTSFFFAKILGHPSNMIMCLLGKKIFDGLLTARFPIMKSETMPQSQAVQAQAELWWMMRRPYHLILTSAESRQRRKK